MSRPSFKTGRSEGIFPKVSVIVCTKGRPLELASCLQGLLRQDYRNFEVIVVDGEGSRDVRELVLSYDYRYVDQARTDTPRNTPSARNLGVKHADGEIVAFIDDDAVPVKHWLSSLVRCYMEYNPAGVGGPVTATTDSERSSDNAYNQWFIRSTFLTIMREDVYGVGRIYRSGLVTQNWELLKSGVQIVQSLIGTNMSFRRIWLDRIGPFDESISTFGVGDETDLCLRVLERGGVILVTSDAKVYHKLSQKGTPTLRRYYSYFSEFYLITKHMKYFSIPKVLTREFLIILYLIVMCASRSGNNAEWRYALRGRLDAYLMTLKKASH
jgi:glycogen(starch) synthase